MERNFCFSLSYVNFHSFPKATHKSLIAIWTTLNHLRDFDARHLSSLLRPFAFRPGIAFTIFSPRLLKQQFQGATERKKCLFSFPAHSSTFFSWNYYFNFFDFVEVDANSRLSRSEVVTSFKFNGTVSTFERNLIFSYTSRARSPSEESYLNAQNFP